MTQFPRNPKKHRGQAERAGKRPKTSTRAGLGVQKLKTKVERAKVEDDDGQEMELGLANRPQTLNEAKV